MASKRDRISPRLVDGLPFLTMGILLVVAAPLPFLVAGVMGGLGVDGLPFIMRFNHCSTGPVTKSPASSSPSSPGGPPGAPPRQEIDGCVWLTWLILDSTVWFEH